jgi:hypothetical protein
MKMNMYEQYKGTIHDFSDRSRMKGNWFAILVITASADMSDDYEEKLVVCKQLRKMQEYFQCGECKEHFGEHITNFPPETEIEKNDGLFYWAVGFLNSVSARIGHELYNIRILYPMFHIPGAMLCESQCKGSNTNTNTNGNKFTVTSRRNNK